MIGGYHEKAKEILEIAKEQDKLGHPENTLKIIRGDLTGIQNKYYEILFNKYMELIKKRNETKNVREREVYQLAVNCLRRLLISSFGLSEDIEKMVSKIEIIVQQEENKQDKEEK